MNLPLETESDSTSNSARGSLLDSPEHVLSTLESDGSRRWLYPKVSKGKHWKRRRALAYFLIIFFVALPHIRISGKPLILLDIASRKFIFFGHTFLPTDTLLLALLMLGVFLTIVLATAFLGRVWCGWACPQTVYMEFLFRPIDRWFEGTTGKGGKPKKKPTGWMAVARYAIYLLLAMLLAHTFLAYFVGTEKLSMWVRSSPFEHPTAFLVMGATTGLMLFDFLFFREQLCLIACPYGRFQSVMLDRQSVIVAYDEKRGEPRKKGRHTAEDKAGDCVDCNQCVVVCPTGIDIRDGLQLECVNCTQCIDACNNVMDRVGSPQGLIRYSSQDALDGKAPRLLRVRTIAYPALLAAVAVAFLLVLSTKFAFDANVMRGRGNPFEQAGAGAVTNNFLMRVSNRTDDARNYTFQVVEPSDAVLADADSGTLELLEGGSELVPVVVKVPATSIGPTGIAPGKIRITDDIGNERIVTMNLRGPKR